MLLVFLCSFSQPFLKEVKFIPKALIDLIFLYAIVFKCKKGKGLIQTCTASDRFGPRDHFQKKNLYIYKYIHDAFFRGLEYTNLYTNI